MARASGDVLRERELFRALDAARRDGRDADAARCREQLIADHLGLVHYCVRRYWNSGEPIEDLVQVGSIGLVQAVDRFDVERGVEFGSFATPTILGEIRRHFRDHTWTVRVPRGTQELVREVAVARDALTAELGRSPTADDVAERLGIDRDAVVDAIEASHAYRADSLDAPVEEGRPDPGFWDAALADVEDRHVVGPLLDSLPEREREIVRLKFFSELSQREIAEQMGISQMHVSRLLARSMEQMRAGAGGSVA
jgi:RNA polymerase sigma-B factor